MFSLLVDPFSFQAKKVWTTLLIKFIYEAQVKNIKNKECFLELLSTTIFVTGLDPFWTDTLLDLLLCIFFCNPGHKVHRYEDIQLYITVYINLNYQSKKQCNCNCTATHCNNMIYNCILLLMLKTPPGSSPQLWFIIF